LEGRAAPEPEKFQTLFSISMRWELELKMGTSWIQYSASAAPRDITTTTLSCRLDQFPFGEAMLENDAMRAVARKALVE